MVTMKTKKEILKRVIVVGILIIQVLSQSVHHVVTDEDEYDDDAEGKKKKKANIKKIWRTLQVCCVLCVVCCVLCAGFFCSCRPFFFDNSVIKKPKKCLRSVFLCVFFISFSFFDF